MWKVGCGVLACLMVIVVYTRKQFHKMHAYIEKVDDSFYNVRFISYSTYMLYMNEKDHIMCARDYSASDSGDHKSTTTQKQVTIFLREFYGEKWLQAYKTAIKFYRSFDGKKDDLARWFYIRRDSLGHFHFTMEKANASGYKIEFYLM